MNLLQIFLVISAIIILILAIDIAKKQKFNALHFLVFFGMGGGLLVFTFFPSALNSLGEFFGLQRGADLLVYSSVIFLVYFVLLLLSKHVDNKESITGLIRELAIENSDKKNIEGKEVFVIPSYNEGQVIEENIKNILKAGYKNILLINDGSSDNSRNILENFGDKIILLNHLKNRGQGASLETGFEYLRRYGKMDYVICYDADGQHSLEDLSKFYKILDNKKNIDIVFGSRFIEKTNSNIPFSRRIILKIAILFTFFLSQIHLTDTHNGYRVFRRKILNKIKITIDGMGHASEIIDIVASKKIKYRELPVDIKYTKYSLAKGQSNSNAIKIAVRFIWSKFFR
ncbi:MAG: DUF2304 family protein [Candidatus Gracilibacteria bacterium]|nr:DUF2304 family protein [Candidatus Gracilibacteria bacterium]